jgi:hypothetical protein
MAWECITLTSGWFSLTAQKTFFFHLNLTFYYLEATMSDRNFGTHGSLIYPVWLLGYFFNQRGKVENVTQLNSFKDRGLCLFSEKAKGKEGEARSKKAILHYGFVWLVWSGIILDCGGCRT